VQYVFALHGVPVPRVVRDQYEVGARVRLDDLEPGDLVFFTTEGRHVSHVGIVIGGDRFVHAPKARGTVRIDSLTSGYWGERVAGARRVN
jgi:cell wall-associated NlpC family hydrolase